MADGVTCRIIPLVSVKQSFDLQYSLDPLIFKILLNYQKSKADSIAK
ncbi:hypothetical protein SAMN06296036_10589 [Pseudobacteriovorax antillogorgiicola]|uniref:Uncharacterized protein n=1 Tax=Pseudobacteriovorax antillogorgiicola TaxID=1513793 RepID=A0A1Y6BMN0_9BACT|nr:hypothetical protein EDD56_105235 [Pseudobacteriovorax antillogorgiicola]SMF11456.1 hypothetical protein SAMN06296036_10589 [Pseudobacteriovorax antillogorgiicola]